VPWALALGLMLCTGHVQAAVETIFLDTGNAALSSLNPGPFATITLTTSGSNVLVDVVADNITTTGLGTGTHASISDFGFNLTGGATVDTSSLVITNVVSGVGTQPPWGFTTSQQFDGFGTYANAVNSGSNNNRAVEISFTVDNATFSSFGKNADGFSFAVHWYSNFTTGDTAHPQMTGFAVPEPSVYACAGTVTLFGLGLGWRRRKARVA
jgi:hypothetical protein